MRLPPRCDRRWFISTFCAGRDDPARGGGDAVWDLVDGFMQYDSMAVLAATPNTLTLTLTPNPDPDPKP